MTSQHQKLLIEIGKIVNIENGWSLIDSQALYFSFCIVCLEWCTDCSVFIPCVGSLVLQLSSPSFTFLFPASWPLRQDCWSFVWQDLHDCCVPSPFLTSISLLHCILLATFLLSSPASCVAKYWLVNWSVHYEITKTSMYLLLFE